MIRLQEALSRGKLPAELTKLRRYSLLIVDEVGNIPFDRWGDVFGDLTIASAMIDRIVHHADVITFKGTSYRLKNHQLATTAAHYNHTTVALFSDGGSGLISGRRQHHPGVIHSKASPRRFSIRAMTDSRVVVLTLPPPRYEPAAHILRGDQRTPVIECSHQFESGIRTRPGASHPYANAAIAPGPALLLPAPPR